MNFPLSFSFKIMALAPQVFVRDSDEAARSPNAVRVHIGAAVALGIRESHAAGHNDIPAAVWQVPWAAASSPGPASAAEVPAGMGEQNTGEGAAPGAAPDRAAVVELGCVLSEAAYFGADATLAALQARGVLARPAQGEMREAVRAVLAANLQRDLGLLCGYS